jgi:hypothetical protein
LDATPRVRLVDFEMAAVDVFSEGLLMAPVSAMPKGSRAIVSICADGGLGTVALLEN